MRNLILLATAMLLASCASSPDKFTFEKSVTTTKGAEQIRNNILTYLNDNNFDILLDTLTNVDSGGRLIAETVSSSKEVMDARAQCVNYIIRSVKRDATKVDIFIRSDSHTNKVIVNTEFVRSWHNASDVDCMSLGTLEAEILERVAH